MELAKKYWIIIVVAIILGIILYRRKLQKDEENREVVEFEKLNALSSGKKEGKDYEDEKRSLANVIKNANAKEKAMLHDLIKGTIVVFSKSYKGKDKKEATDNYQKEMSKFNSDLVAKYGMDTAKSLKEKMDKYGFDI